MPNTAEDISIVLSGGSGNLDPNLSLGGDPSSSPILDGSINNLFDDVSPEEAEDGHEDYRCFYVFNDGDESVYNVNIWVQSEVEGGSTVELGIKNSDELQRITLSGALPTSGTVTFSFEGAEFSVPPFSDLAAAAQFIEDSLNALVDGDGEKLLETVQVSTPSSLGSPTLIFDILFTINDGSTDHEQLEIVSNDFLPPEVTVAVTTPQEGSPINTVAPEIPNSETPPGGVGFFVPSEQSPISVYKLRPAEGMPIWVKRVTPAGVESLELDGVTVRFRMETIEP